MTSRPMRIGSSCSLATNTFCFCSIILTLSLPYKALFHCFRCCEPQSMDPCVYRLPLHLAQRLMLDVEPDLAILLSHDQSLNARSKALYALHIPLFYGNIGADRKST